MIGTRIKRARIAKGLSQLEVAKETGFSEIDVSRFEEGELKPTSKTLISFSRALDVRIEFFLRPSKQLKHSEYRSSLTKEQFAYVEANILDVIERFLELKELCPKHFFTEFTIPEELLLKKEISPEESAHIMRKEWQLGANKIANLKNVFEKHGSFLLYILMQKQNLMVSLQQ